MDTTIIFVTLILVIGWIFGGPLVVVVKEKRND
jgi:hypothetical protein